MSSPGSFIMSLVVWFGFGEVIRFLSFEPSLTHCPSSLTPKLSRESRGVHWAVSGSARSGSVAAAGLCLVLWEAERTGSVSQHRGQSESMPGEASHSDEQHQEQSSGPHRSAGGTRCCVHALIWDCTKCIRAQTLVFAHSIMVVLSCQSYVK